MTGDDADELRVPIVEERLRIDTETVETDRVRVRTIVEERRELVEQVLQTGHLTVSRIPLDTEVAEAPAPREDGDTLIVSIVEERLVKRLFLVEELHVVRSSDDETVSIPVSLRRMRAVVERDDINQHETGKR